MGLDQIRVLSMTKEIVNSEVNNQVEEMMHFKSFA